MRVSTMVRATLLASFAVALGACSDATSAPQQRALTPHGLFAGKGTGRQNIDNSVQSTSFVVDPSQAATYKFGNHSVTFPAYSICDPATSGYGEDLWDAPCAPLTAPITITATWSNKHGHSFVDFEPELRFVPTDDAAQYVSLTLKDTPAMTSDGVYVILWQRPSDGLWVNEGAFDATMKEVVDLNGNTVSRRIKHFSGYNIGSGDTCDPILNPDWCLPTSNILQ